MLGLILNFIVIVLLSFTILFCSKLNKKIVELKASRQEMVHLIKTLDGAIVNIHKNITTLKETSISTSGALKQEIDKADLLTNDLSFITDKASKIADKLDSLTELAKLAESTLKINVASVKSHMEPVSAKSKKIVPSVSVGKKASVKKTSVKKTNAKAKVVINKGKKKVNKINNSVKWLQSICDFYAKKCKYKIGVIGVREGC